MLILEGSSFSHLGPEVKDTGDIIWLFIITSYVIIEQLCRL